MSGFDLHLHSAHSDGKLSVPEIALIIKEKKLEYCALADHNSVDGIQELINALKGSGIKVIPAAELTAKYNDNEVHVLAYDFKIDLVAEIIKERNEIVRSQKVKEMEVTINLSREAGLNVSTELSPNEKQPVSLTVALDVCANSANQNLFLNKYGKQFIPEDVYYEYQAPGKSCAVERSGVTVEWLIQKFKGIAQDLIIAHPFVSVSVVTRPLNEPEINDLLRIGLTGIEVYHNNTAAEQIDLLKRIAMDKLVHYTGGSDFHGKKTDTPIGQYGPASFVPSFYLANYKASLNS
ncbi:MAG: PHP domain-containing protein [Patescibacteria group bacterium]|nr:PHP domain-containing protein [Patescibacteria group bacterium]